MSSITSTRIASHVFRSKSDKSALLPKANAPNTSSQEDCTAGSLVVALNVAPLLFGDVQLGSPSEQG